MTWTEILAGISAAIGLIVGADRVIQRLLSGKYATCDEVRAMEKTFKTEQVLQSAGIKDAHHRVDLVIESMKGLPGYGHLNDLKKEVGEVKEGLAINNTKLEGISDDIHQMRAAIDRIGDQIHRRGQ
jgi:hypothetical protein